MPLFLARLGSVRASRIAKSASEPQVVHTFCPLTIHSSPSSTARVASDARSEPAPGSLKSWHHFSSLRTIGPRKRRFCSSVPCANSAAAVLLSPSGLSARRLNGVSTARIAPAVSGVTPRPPYSGAQVGMTSPDAPNTGYHASYSARPRTSRMAALPPRAAASRHATGTCSSTQVLGEA